MTTLREARESRNVTREHLAQMAQVSVSTIVRAERDQSVSLKIARKISAALALTPEEQAAIWNGGAP